MTSSNPYFLSHGAHGTREAGMCAMEWVAYMAGERHTDGPVCVSPVLRSFCIRLNDRLGDEDRQKLRPYLARTIGTKGDGLDKERIRMCREWLIHHALPRHLDNAGRTEAAEHLRSLPDALTEEATLKALRFARDEAWDAREKAVERLGDRIRGELAKRGYAVAVAAADTATATVAVAVADAVAAAVAVADTATAADAAAVAVAAADTAAAAVAVADAATAVAAVADAAADAVADTAAAAVAVADAATAPWSVRSAVYEAVRERVREAARKRTQEINRETLPAALDLLDRMLPTEVVQLPVVEEWREICQVTG